MEGARWQATGHGDVSQGSRGEERRRKRWREEEARRSTTVNFQAYGRTLVAVAEFKYIGKVLTDSYDDWPEVVGNLRKAWKRWGRMLGILERGGGRPPDFR